MAARWMMAGVAVGAMALAGAVFGQGAATPAEVVERLDFHVAQPLKLEAVGLSSVKAWYRELTPGRANDESGWKQLVWFKRDARTAAKSYFAVVDFASGTVKELPTCVPAMEPWESMWLEGKYYLGTNLPARLTVYDPATDVLTDLGACFSDKSATCYRMAVSTDGMLVIGGGTGSDVSMYDPKTKVFTHYGQVATKPGGGTYAYYLSADEKYIYVAVRSSDPWELVRLDRKTKERKVLVTTPAQGHMSINGSAAEASGVGAKKWFNLVDGQAVETTADKRVAQWKTPGPGFTGVAPVLAIDQSPVVRGEDALTVHMQTPDGKGWREAKLGLKLDVADITQLAVMDDGRLVGLPKAYFAMVIVDPKSGKTERVPMQISAYGLLPWKERIFISGYPSARTMVFDTTKPMTWVEGLPDRPGVKETEAGANPKLLRFLGQDTGGAHIGMLLTKGVDGNVYMIARRHRYFYGFSLVWFAPEPSEKGEFVSQVFDDKGAFDHLQISTMQPVDGGRQLLISTQVQYNKQIPGQAPESAAVLLFDVASRSIVWKCEPVKGAKKIAVATWVGNDTIVGSAEELKKEIPATLFRFNAREKKLEQTRHVNWGMGGNLTARGDGKVWGTVLYGNFGVVFTVDPKDLSTKPVGRTEDARTIGLLFAGEQVYLSGFPRVMRLVEGKAE